MAGLLDDPEKMNQLMQSPLIQMGLGLLANNKGQYAMQNALGGAGQGFAQSQDYAQQAQVNAYKKQQYDMQKAQYDQQQAQEAARKSALGGVAQQYGIDPNVLAAYPSIGEDMIKSSFGKKEPIKLGKDDRLIDPLTNKEIIGAVPSSSSDFTPDRKNYEYAKENGYTGSFTDFMRIKPQAMMPIAMANLGVAQQRLGIDQAQADYNLPATPKPQAQSYSVSAGGKTYTFKDRKSMNNFKLQAGVK